jgi:hypothetical protein
MYRMFDTNKPQVIQFGLKNEMQGKSLPNSVFIHMCLYYTLYSYLYFMGGP